MNLHRFKVGRPGGIKRVAIAVGCLASMGCLGDIGGIFGGGDDGGGLPPSVPVPAEAQLAGVWSLDQTGADRTVRVLIDANGRVETVSFLDAGVATTYPGSNLSASLRLVSTSLFLEFDNTDDILAVGEDGRYRLTARINAELSIATGDGELVISESNSGVENALRLGAAEFTRQ